MCMPVAASLVDGGDPHVAAEDGSRFAARVRSEVERHSAARGVAAPTLSFGAVGLGLRPDGVIAFGQATVDALLFRLDGPAREVALRFLVGHEAWHHAQWSAGIIDFARLGPEARRQAECEADVMAVLWALSSAPAGARADVVTAVADLLERLATNAGGHHLPASLRLRVLQHSVGRALVGQPLEPMPPAQQRTLARNLEKFAGPPMAPDAWAQQRCRLLLQQGVLGAVTLKSVTLLPHGAGSEADRGTVVRRVQAEFGNDADRPVRLRGLAGNLAPANWLLSATELRLHRFERVILPGQTWQLDALLTLGSETALPGAPDARRFLSPRHQLPDSEALLEAEFVAQPACGGAATAGVGRATTRGQANRLIDAWQRLARDAMAGFPEASRRLDEEDRVHDKGYRDAGISDLELSLPETDSAMFTLTLIDTAERAERDALHARVHGLLSHRCAGAPGLLQQRGDNRLRIGSFTDELTLVLTRDGRTRTRRGVSQEWYRSRLIAHQRLPGDAPARARCTVQGPIPTDDFERGFEALLVQLASDAELGFLGTGSATGRWWLGDDRSRAVESLPLAVTSATLKGVDSGRATGYVVANSTARNLSLFNDVAEALRQRCAALPGDSRVRVDRELPKSPELDVPDFVPGLSLRVWGDGSSTMFELRRY